MVAIGDGGWYPTSIRSAVAFCWAPRDMSAYPAASAETTTD